MKMPKLNENYLNVQDSYLFAEIARRVKVYEENNPDKAGNIIRLGIGDVTRPLTKSAIDGLHKAVDEQAVSETFKGYGPEQGYVFVREAVSDYYKRNGVSVDPDAVFISDGAKSDTGNITELFAKDNVILVPDPVYPVYVDTNVMAGRTGTYDPKTETWSDVIYMSCTAENGFAPAYAAYIFGFLCHFALDRECHDYIAEKIASSGARHAHIEVSFDRKLLVADGYNPVKKRLVEHISATEEMSKVISKFYPGVTPKNIHTTIRSMVFYSGLLRAPNKFKRGVICAILKLSGNYREMRGMLMDYEPDPVCADSDEILMQRYKSAIPKAVKLITEFEDSVKGNIPFNPLYRYSFDSTLQDEKK